MSRKRNAAPAIFDSATVPLVPGVTLVEASAGTGKTFAITRLLLRLLVEKKVENLSRILVVTFTEKATQELVTRIRSTLRLMDQIWSEAPPLRDTKNGDLFDLRDRHGAEGREIIRAALGSLDDLSVSTIHGFCQRMLAESALESRIPFYTTFVEDETEAFASAANDWARKSLFNDPTAASLVVGDGGAISGWVKQLITPYRRQLGTRLDYDQNDPAQSLLADFIRTVDDRFEREKQRRHLLGFDDLLRKLSVVLEAEGADGPLARRIRGRFGAALIDEFQDTDQTQFPIFSNAFHGCPLFLIGDPKQSIYRFRGADIDAYLRAADAADTRYTLPANYRSTATLVRAVEALFTRAPDPFQTSGRIDFVPVRAATAPDPPGGLATDGGKAFEWWWIAGSLGKTGKSVSKDDATGLLVPAIANEIVRLTGQGLRSDQIAVLVRSNREARQVKAGLDEARIPAAIAGDEDVLLSEEGEELIRLAEAVATPTDHWAVRAAMATRLWGRDAQSIAALLDDDGEREWRSVVDRLTAARERWRERGVAAALGDLLATERALDRLLLLPDGERRLTNLRHVIEIFHEAWATEAVMPEGFSAWVARERSLPNVPGRRELRLESDSDAVQVLTIHKAKGLEFDVVFCPSLWQSYSGKRGPLGAGAALATDAKGAVLDLGSAEFAKRQAEAEAMDRAEGIRLAYVALTRAVHRCYIAWGEIGKDFAQDSALGHLLRTSGTEKPRAVLEALVAASGGTMRVSDIEARPKRLVSGAVAATEPSYKAMPLTLGPGQLESWQLTSFTGMVADRHSEDARDVADPELTPAVQEARVAPKGFRGFPGGIQAGNALHAILERIDLRRVAEPETRERVRRTLQAHNLLGDAVVAEQRLDDLAAMLGTVATAEIPGAGFALDRVPYRVGMREWRFQLSVGSVSAGRIADVLAAHGSAHAKAYAPTLRLLREHTVRGYLSGSVDLAFEQDGRWWLLDWKSNWLGDTDADYDQASLSAAMMEAHYTLQYHLYLLALHRHLLWRQPGYNPALHWGGVAYLFLRGVGATGDNGWFRDTPTPALLEALDTALGRRA